MKKKHPTTRYSVLILFVIPLIFLLFYGCEKGKKEYEAEVKNAYEVRINGNADSAIILLDLVIAEDSTIAMAWYELSRTENHMGLGDMQNMMEHQERAMQYIDNALVYDPMNPAYLYFKGKLQSINLYTVLQMGNIWWRFKLVKAGNPSNNPLQGKWKVAPEAGALGVGPMRGDISWWAVDEAIVSERACFFDDTYVFGTDGSFRNDLGTETWIEDWQNGSNACGTPVAPHDGTASANYVYDESTGKLTLNGTGAYLGIPKAYNGGELRNPADAPSSVTYIIEFSENNRVLTADINAGGGNIRDILVEIENTYQKLLEIDPGFHAAKLSLVELFAFVPPEMGGNKVKAEKYTNELESEDLVWGAKAREILMPEDSDYINYWSDLKEKNDNNADIAEALGRAYLNANDTENAWKNFEIAIDLDKNKNDLYLEMGRYYMMMAMQGQMQVDIAVPLITAEFEKYLDSQPEPNNAMKAWTKGQLAMLKYRTGNEEAGNLLLKEAEELDRYFSRAFGTPDEILFIPPNSVSQTFNYLSRPF